MPHQADYEKFADECVQLAQRAQLPEHRIMLMHIAETWQRLAADSASRAPAGPAKPGQAN